MEMLHKLWMVDHLETRSSPRVPNRIDVGRGKFGDDGASLNRDAATGGALQRKPGTCHAAL